MIAEYAIAVIYCQPTTQFVVQLLSHEIYTFNIRVPIAILYLSILILTLLIVWLVQSQRIKVAHAVTASQIKEHNLAAELASVNEDSFRLLVEGAKDYAIFLLDTKGYIISWNAGAERIQGYLAEEIIGKHFSCFYLAEDVENGKPYFELEIATNEGKYEEKGLRIRKDGSRFWANVLITALKDSSGNLRGFSQVTQDITERQKVEELLKESDERFQQVAENIHEVFWLSNPQKSKMIYISPAYQEIWGRTCESLYQKPNSFIDSIHPEDREGFLIQLLQHRLGKYYDATYRIIKPNGEVRWIHDRGFPIKNSSGIVERVAGIAEDITDRKTAEAEIYKALQIEKELNELQARFITTTSHTFRTPLATILSATELLEHYGHKFSPEHKQKLFDQIKNTVQEMTQILNDILIINRTEAGELKLKTAPLNLENLLQYIVEEMQIIMGVNHQISLVHQGNCSNVVMDERLLWHIFYNLLSNAIKYSPKGGKVQVQLICEDRQVICSIQDSGIGVPDEEQKLIFEPFHRANNIDNIPGTGMGLSVAKKFVDLHGGNITLESKVDVGSRFVVTIPFK
ncbi:MAG TPA: PAS domain-containing sensor histidine kinase [Oculatellaceae cyanobacterium]|jgi:PAS domain S-box-containing protein